MTKPANRWKLVGNAVTVNTVEWIARKIINPQKYDSSLDKELVIKKSWPKSAWGIDGIRKEAKVSIYPSDTDRVSLTSFLQFPRKPLSLKATKGFQKRLLEGGMHSPQYFKEAIEHHIEIMSV